jgi:sucrose-6-phosphate hydrolase SacC (GH32 family)
MEQLWMTITLIATIAAASSASALAQTSMPTQPPGGFLFVTFRGQENPLSEQVYFNISKDGRNWTALNNGDPVLVSNLGEKGVRDPYLVQSPDRKKFFLIGTDLSWARDRNGGRAIRAGSRSLVIWESTDLVQWSEPRLVAVAPDDAGCAWAPEAVYDGESGDYLVFWASTTKQDKFAKHRIWSARTRDFKQFSKPEVFIERPFPVIDTTIVREGDRYYRFTKREDQAVIFAETSDRLSGEWKPLEGFNLASTRGVEGPQCFMLRPADGDRPAVWCLLLDHYRGGGYKAYVTDNLARGHFEAMEGVKFPFPPRHGSVISISTEEYLKLQQRFASAKTSP